jgi:hypothetical protein
VAEGRRARLWSLIAETAAAHEGPASAGDACAVAVAAAGLDGGWLSVMTDPARRALVHATGGRAAEVEALQFTLGEGPSTDAFSTRSPVLVADLGEPGWRERWPGFAVAGELAGVAAVFAFPVTLGAIRLGVLGLYRESPGSLSPGALADVLVCVDAALLLLLEARAGIDGDVDGRPVDGWNAHHAQVYQASGMVSAQRGVGLEESLSVLRAYAFANDLTLDEVAAAVVSRRLRLERGPAG